MNPAILRMRPNAYGAPLRLFAFVLIFRNWVTSLVQEAHLLKVEVGREVPAWQKWMLKQVQNLDHGNS